MQTQPQHRTLRSWVYDTLRERIIAGDLTPGAQIVEARLSEEFGISRSPIREALRQLGQEGFVHTLQNSATTVTTCNHDEVDQIMEVRDLLESCLIAHAAIARDAADLKLCRELMKTMEELAALGNIRDFASADVTFHERLWRMAKRPRVLETLLPVSAHARRYLNVQSRERKFETTETMTASCAEHIEILAGIEAGDVAHAVAASQKHMQSSRRRILEGGYRASEKHADENEPDQAEDVLVYTVLWTGANQ